MSESVAIVGAGICGMCTALALSQSGFRVSIFERDVPPPSGNPDQAFFEWTRRGAAQFRHPHAFLGLMCSVLEERYPELLEDFFAAGARKVEFKDMIPPHLLGQYQPEPGDEKIWVLMCRRATIETVLRRYVEKIENIEIHNKTFITDIEIENQNGQKIARGLQITDRENSNQKSSIEFDLVIDATGRSSKFHQWLEAKGISVREQRDDAEIVYYTRHYKMLEGVVEPSRHQKDPSMGDLGYMKYGVFPGDGGHFALIICLPLGETELREAIKTGEGFDSVCRTIPGLLPWIAQDKAKSTTDPFGIGQIHAVWRDYLTNGQPQILNFFAVGDSHARTNPLYGRGCSTGTLHAHILADVLGTTNDPIKRAISFSELTKERIGPIFDASLREDKNGIRKSSQLLEMNQKKEKWSLKKWFGQAFGDALGAAAREKIFVHRGIIKTINLLEKPGEFLQDPKIRRTVLMYMLRGRKKNIGVQRARGLERTQMIEHISTLS